MFFQDIPDFTADSITAVVRKYVYNYGVGLVLFDYIKLPEFGDDNKDEWEIIYALARRLKYLCKTLNIPILAALQQNREGDDKSRVTGRAFASSDGVLKECDGMFPLNQKPFREVEQDGLDYGTHILQIYKLRNGPKSFKGINLDFKGYCLRFEMSKKQTEYIKPPVEKPNAKANINALNKQIGKNDREKTESS